MFSKPSGKAANAKGLRLAADIQMDAERMNQLMAQRMGRASRRCRTESMRVNDEFAAIERDPRV
jgi:hypothetical protein